MHYYTTKEMSITTPFMESGSKTLPLATRTRTLFIRFSFVFENRKFA